jgi:hypothetical protein
MEKRTPIGMVCKTNFSDQLKTTLINSFSEAEIISHSEN